MLSRMMLSPLEYWHGMSIYGTRVAMVVVAVVTTGEIQTCLVCAQRSSFCDAEQKVANSFAAMAQGQGTLGGF